MKRAWLSAIGDGAHAATAPIGSLRDAAVVPSDRYAARGLPAWRATERLAARALLRLLLADVVGREAAASPLWARPHGAPYLADQPDLPISMSHTDGWVCAAVGVEGGLIGVDAQVPYTVGARMIRRCCTAMGRDRLASLPPRERAREFAWIWTAQEACVKATGAGLAGQPWRIPVEPGQRSGEWRGVRWIALLTAFPLPVSCAYGPAGPTNAITSRAADRRQR